MGMMNDDALLRLESNWCKHLHQQIFQVPEDEIVSVVFPLFIAKCMSNVSVAAKPLQLDHSNDSLWVPDEEIAVVVFPLFIPKCVSIGTVPEDEIVVVVFPLFTPKCVSIGTVMS
eukprot:scaffold10334_cov54-Cyclotella_meneghiniana.AAC.11